MYRKGSRVRESYSKTVAGVSTCDASSDNEAREEDLRNPIDDDDELPESCDSDIKPSNDNDREEPASSAAESQDEESLQKSGDDGSDPGYDQAEGSDEGDTDASMLDNNPELEMTDDESPKQKKKKRTPGIVYLSYIPDGLTVAKTRELLGEFGDIKRMYFEPVKKLSAKTRPLHRFREGWIEFGKKKDAKRVAELLNTKPVGGKRRAPYRDCLWSIKYLNRFRWPHLAERLTYEKAVKDQRMRTEIAKAKREARFYAKTLEQSIRRRKKRQCGETYEENPSRIKLRKTDKEIREEKPEPASNEIADKSLLMSIFAKE